MLEKIVAKHALDKLLEQIDQPLAIADNNQKIIWYNQNFKSILGNVRIKGRSFVNLLNSLIDNFDKNLLNTSDTSVHIDNYGTALTIKDLRTDKKLDGYILKIEDRKPQASSADIQNEISSSLNLITKEKSLDNLLQSFLKKSIAISAANFGFIVIHSETDKDEFYIDAPQNKIEEFNDLEKEISSDLIFITKWLKTNKRSLSATNAPNNLGFNLTRILGSQSLLISPAFSENKLLATVIIGKTKGHFENSAVQNVEFYSTLISVALSLHSTRGLSEAIEKRLMQSQKLETIGKLASGMAHDFSNLLASILGSTNLLRKRVPENEKTTKFLDNIDNCSFRAQGLIKGLLSFGKPTQDVQELIKPNFLLSEISKVITQTFPKKITFKTDISEDLNNILGNGTQIYQVLLNLCVNAKESMEGEGEITLHGHNFIVDEENIIEHPHLNKGNYVLFSVKDTGSGISEDNLRKIFDPYFSTKKKESGSGSGLGLFVSYGIIKTHGGHIEVSSIFGAGTKFEVFIPAYEPVKKAKISQTNKIILLAEDEEMLSELLSELLESNGYNVIKVVNGIEVLKVLTEEIKVDLAIIDYNMPEMNGIDCIKNIRKLNLDIPVILSSGSLKPQNSSDIKSLGIDEILPKPYEFETLVKTIQKLI